MGKKKKRNSKKSAPAPINRSGERSGNATPDTWGPSLPQFVVLAISLGLLTLWAYWPTFVWMEDQWRNEPDYSHGYLIIPLSLVLLYFRRDSMPSRTAIDLSGVSLLVLAIAVRIVGRFAYMDFLDGWSLSIWVAGLVWVFFGRSFLWWAAPAIAFLLLLVPMPYRAESLLSFKLQGLATILSTGCLQLLGLPAVPDGNTIWLGEEQLMVEEACSGLRIFMGMAALGFFFAVLADRSWLDRVVILASALPIAIFVNVVRVTATGLAFYWLDEPYSKQAHDLLGILMIVMGAACLAGVKSFWEAAYRPVEVQSSVRAALTKV